MQISELLEKLHGHIISFEDKKRATPFAVDPMVVTALKLINDMFVQLDGQVGEPADLSALAAALAALKKQVEEMGPGIGGDELAALLESALAEVRDRLQTVEFGLEQVDTFTKQEVGRLDEALLTIVGQVDNLTKIAAENAALDAAQQQALDELKQRAAELIAQFADLKTAVSTVADNDKNQNQRITDLRTDLADLQVKVASIHAGPGGISAEDVKNLIDEKLGPLADSLAGLQLKQAADHDAQLALAAEISLVEIEIAGLKTADADGQKAIAELRAALEKLQSDLAADQLGEAGQNQKLTQIFQELAELRAKLGDGTGGISLAEAQKLVDDAVHILDEKLAGLQLEIDAEKTKQQALATALANVQADILSLKITDSQLAANLQNAVAGLQNAIDKLRFDADADRAGEVLQNQKLDRIESAILAINLEIDRLKSAPPGGISIDQAKNLIEQSLADIRSAINSLKLSDDQNAAADATQWEAIHDLEKRLDKIIIDPLDLDAVKLLILKELASWQALLDSKILLLENGLSDGAASVQKLIDRILLIEAWISGPHPDGGLGEAAVLNLILGKIAELKAEIQLEIDGFSGKILTINDEIKAANGAIAAIGARETLLENRATVIESKIGTTISEIDGLKTRASAAETEAAALKTGLAATDLKITGLDARTTAAETETAALKTGLAATDGKITGLDTRTTAAEGKITGLEIKAGVAEGLISLVKTGLTDAQTRLAIVEELIKNLGTGTGTSIGEAAIRLLIQAAITELRAALDITLADLRLKLDALAALPGKLADLENRVNNLPPAGASLTEVRNLIDASLLLFSGGQTFLEFKTEINNKLDGLNKDLLKQEILASLELWKTGITGQLALFETKIGEDADVAALQKQIDDLRLLLDGEPPEKWAEHIKSLFETWKTTLFEQVEKLILEKCGCAEKCAEQADLIKKLSDAVNALPVDLLGESGILALIAEAETRILTEIAAKQGELSTKIGALEAFNLTLANLPPLDSLAAVMDFFKTAFPAFRNLINGQLADHDGRLKTDREAIENLEAEVKKLTGLVATGSSENSPGERLARLGTMGWGVIGGLELQSDDRFRLHLTRGSGLTPDGFLLVEPNDRLFNYYLSVDEKAERQAFFISGKNGKTSPIKIWELLEIKTGTPPEGAKSLVPNNEKELDMPFSVDRVVVAQLGPDGRPQYFLMGREDFLIQIGQAALAKKLMGGPKRRAEFSDFTHGDDHSPLDQLPDEDKLYLALDPAMRLPEIPLFRFGFRPAPDCSPAELDDPEFPNVTSLDILFDTWVPIIDDALGQLDDVSKILMAEYHKLLFPQLADKEAMAYFNETQRRLLGNWAGFKHHAATPKGAAVRPFVQYFYDWARDLIAGYHELRRGLQELMSELLTLTPETLGNRHGQLALGMAVRPNPSLYETPVPGLHLTNGLAAPLRDHFRQPPIFNLNGPRLETVRLYYRRLFELIESFYLPGFLAKDRLPKCCCDDENEPTEPDFSRLKITPGMGYFHALSEQSLPFYYPLANTPGSLHYFWNYRRTKNRTVNRLLSYHAWAEGQLAPEASGPQKPAPESYSDLPEVVRPLFYSLDGSDFYRVEGLIGKSSFVIDGETMDVRRAVDYLIKKNNLDFGLMPFYLPSNPLPPTRNYGSASKPQYTFLDGILGAEHLGGVPKGGTFIVLFENWKKTAAEPDNWVAVADFATPYRLNLNIASS